MFAQQREFGLLLVIEDDLFPIFLVVASLALRPEFAFVRFVILFLMAREAKHGRIFELVVWVTFCALHFFVLAQQFELGLIVIEVGHLPILGGMAVLALVAQFALMSLVIILLMATYASLWNAFVLAVDVALRALHFDVLSDQFEFGLIVIKTSGLPIFFCMALSTVLTQFAFVCLLVIFLMTVKTYARRLAEFLTGFMAALAFDLFT